MFEKLIALFTLPIMVLNFVGGLVGGIWLAFLGEWRLIGIGIAMLFTSHMVLGILIMIGFPLAALGLKMMKKFKPIGLLLGFLGQFYTNLLILLTCGIAYFLCISFFSSDSVIAFIPYLLWSWGMALGPWQYMASKEPDNEFSGFTIFVAAAFYLLFLVSLFINSTLALIILAVWTFVQLIILPIFNMYLANEIDKANQWEY